jgi:hypothetical protein
MIQSTGYSDLSNGYKNESVMSNSQALELLVCEIPSLSLNETFAKGMAGRNAWNNRNAREAYECRVIAARNYEKLALSQPKDSIDAKYLLEDSALSYDRAAKNAVLLGCMMAAIICRIRACRMHKELCKTYDGLIINSPLEGYKKKRDFAQVNLSYSQAHILEIINRNSSEILENGAVRDNWAKKNKMETIGI